MSRREEATGKTDSPAPLGIAGRLAAAFQDNALTPLLALVALLLGVFAVVVTPREEEPQIDVTMANVMIAFPGASSADVQNLVALPAEQVLSQIAGIEHTYSVSRPGMAMVTVQFEVGVPRTEALVRLYDVLNANQDWLPRNLGVLAPIVKPKGIDDVPVLAVTLHASSSTPALDLERIAHSIETELKRVTGAREVRVIGGPGRAMMVSLDPARLRARGVDLLQLAAALSAANQGLPAGAVLEGAPGNASRVAVEVSEYLPSADAVGEIIVGVHRGQPVFLREVAHIEDGAAQLRSMVWHTPGAASGDAGVGAVFPAVTLALTKKPGSNAADVARAARARIDSMQGTLIPAEVTTTITRDYGQTASDKANQLMQKLAFATGTVILLVGFALGRREAVIVGTAVILTLTATLFASWAWGFTLNRVSLFALIFSIGILVDDAIVVVENIHRHQLLAPGRPLRDIIPLAVDEVGGPTILATLTVIAALLPMAFVTGLMGPYMGPIPINASLGMALSLAIAFTLTPWLALKLMPGHAHGEPSSSGLAAGWIARLTGAFPRWLGPLLAESRKRRRLALGILLALFASVGLAAVQAVVLKMLPFDNKSEFQVVVRMPTGSPVEETARLLQALGHQLAAQPEVVHVQAYAGTASPITFNGLVRQYDLRQEAELGDLQVNLVGKSERSEQSHAIAQRLRPALEAIAQDFGAKLQVVEVPPGPPVLSPLVAEVYGPDESGRQALTRGVAAAFAATEDIVGIDTTLLEDAPRVFLRVNRQRAEANGIPVAAIAATAQGALSGLDAAYLHDARSRVAVPVRLQLPPQRQSGLSDLLAMPLRAADGKLVPLGELVDLERDVVDAPRYTKNLQGVSYVFADVGAGGETPDSPLYGLFKLRAAALAAGPASGGPVAEHWIAAPQDPWRGYAIKWDGEWQITYETFRDMGAAYAVGLVLIYLLVVAQFRSYLTPLIIMAPIPLTIIGVMPGHALLGANFTATSMIGMIALAGIIVRNSILLVDFIELRLAQGARLREAVIESAVVRAQPIALTALAAMAGAFFILDDPIFNGLAISLVFGILVSTLLTLVVIPILYYVVYRGRAHA